MKHDYKTQKMLEGELDRIIAEVTADCTDIAERNYVIFMIMEITLNTAKVPARIKRRTHEVLSRFYAIVEGLEKANGK